MSQQAWSELSFEELLVRARAEEAGALEELLRRSQDWLGTLASRRVTPETPGGNRPSDVAQESALRAFRKFASFKGSSEGEWRSWLKTIVLSRAADMVREARGEVLDASGHVALDSDEAAGVSAPQRSPSHVTSIQEEWRQLLTCFFQLPEEQREALSLFHLKGRSVAGIAQRMGKSQDAVASLMQRGSRTLRNRMAGGSDTAAEDTPEQVAARNAVDAALLVYFRRREAGEAVDPEAFAAGFPLAEEELRGILHWLERLREIHPPEAG